MASPLSFFRKYQKVMLVVFGVALMAIFLIGPFFDQMNSFGVSQNVTQDTVMAEWKGGKVTRADLNMMRFRHFRTAEFLAGVQSYVQQKNKDTFVPLAQMIAPLLPEGTPESEEAYDEAVMERYLRAQKAQEEGVAISDTMVTGYILQLAGNADLSTTELEMINRKVNASEMELPQIREHLKLELAAQTYSVMTTVGLNFNSMRNLLPSPTEAIQLYTKTSRRIECEVYPLVISDYMDKVTEQPSDAELRKLFNEGRYELPDVLNMKPGFKAPKRADVEYFVGELEPFLVNEMNKLTDKEVQEEYDRLVAAKDPLVMEELNLGPNAALPPSTPPVDAPNTPPTAEANKTEGGVPPASTENKTDEGAKTGEAKSEGTSTTEGAGEKKEGGENNSGGGSPELDPTTEVYTSTNLSVPQEETAEKKQEETAEKKQEETGDKKQEEAAKVDNPQTPPVAADQDQPPVAPPADQNPVTPAPERKPKPLKDVADQIKRRLKSPAAMEVMNKAIEKAEEAVQDYQAQLSEWESDPELQRQPKPTPPDFAAVAKELGLNFKSTGMMSISQMADSEFGKVMVFVQEARQVFTHMQIVFGQFHSWQIYNPISTNELMASRYYLFWLKEKADSKPVEFADAKENVLAFWKRQKAMSLATAEAQKIADNVNQSGKSLTELYGDKAANTGEFSWFGLGMGGGFDYGTPVGVPAAAEEFMKAAFSLQTGKAGVGNDELNERVYVIRMVRDDNRTPEMFAQEFYDRVAKDQMFPQEMFQVAQTYLRNSFVDWQRAFHKEMGLNWVGR